MGLLRGDLLYVHTSMKAIGWVEGGPRALLEAFLDVLGTEGTIVAPTHTLSFPGRGAEPYDPAATPTILGAFPEALRRDPRAHRSGHASHSSAGIGKQAAWLAERHDPTNALGYDSPLHRIWRENGKILLLGVSQTSNTTIHLGESLAGAPYVKAPYDESWGKDVHALLPGGAIARYRQTEFPGCSEEFARLEPAIDSMAGTRQGFVGNARSRLMLSRDVVSAAKDMLAVDTMALLCDEIGCHCCARRKEFLRRLGLAERDAARRIPPSRK
jgi:aminoglycoside 3-N-acetyltransferase